MTDLLLGRDAQCAAIDRALAGARTSRSAVLVLHGEAGVGKSALLGYARSRASGLRILAARPVQ